MRVVGLRPAADREVGERSRWLGCSQQLKGEVDEGPRWLGCSHQLTGRWVRVQGYR